MAPFAFDLLDEEQQKKAQDQQAQDGSAAPAMTGGGESFAASSAPQSSAEKGVQKQGSGFVGLDKYMQANQGSNFGGQVAGKVRENVEGAKQGLAQGADAFTQASNQGATKWNDVQDQFKGIVDQAGDSTSKDDAAKAQGFMGAKYQGPESFSSSAYGAQAQGGLQKATQQANALQSEGGRFALLDQFYGRPKYSMGEKSLDNLLVQNAPGVAAKAQSIGGQAKQLAAEAGQTGQNLNNLAASNRAATAETAKQSRDYLGNARTGFETDLSKRYGDYLKGNDDYNKARFDDVSDDSLDADTLGLTGLQEGTNLYGVNLSNYLQQNPNASMGQFASDKDYARYLALSQLAGEDPSLLSADTRGDAGKGATMGRAGFDKQRFTNDLNQAQQGWNNQKAALYQANNVPADMAPEEVITNYQDKLAHAEQAAAAGDHVAAQIANMYRTALQQFQNLVAGRHAVRKAGG